MGLYTKIKGDVNYTTVGNLTIADGIASGFSNSNYLELSNFDPSKPFELRAKIKSTQIGQRQVIYGVGTAGVLRFLIFTNGKLEMDLGTSTSSFNICSIQSSIILSANTDYWVSLIFTGSKYTMSYSTDNITFTELGSVNSTLLINNGTKFTLRIGIGVISSTTTFFNGSIDLNETYVNINNTAWFGTSFSKVKISNGSDGYTIIGSPIINQGTMTNLSPSDYITTKLSYTNIGSFEINIKCKLPSNFESKMPIVVSYGNKLILGLNSGRRIYALFNNGAQGITGTTTLSLSGIYYLRYTLDENKVAKVYVSIDGKTYSLEGSITLNDTNYNAVYTNSSKLQIGTWSYGHSYSSVDTIYLNQSNIIINNKMIWNGIHQDITSWKIKQDNFSKYYTIVDGKLMWANPNIYLESTGTQWIDTGIKANQNTTLKCKVATIGSGNQSFFGLVDNSDIYGIGQQASGSLLFAQYYGSSSYRITAMAGNDGIARKFEFIKNEFYIDGVLIGSKTYKTFTTTNTIKLFTLEPTGTLGQDKGYYFEIYDDTVLIRKFVPVPKGLLIGNFVVPSNGMFDIVEQKFYENQGTGEFEIGGIPEDYIIEGGKMIWCNPDIYLESTGTQYIETNHFANSGTLVEGSFQFTDTTVQQRVFGADSSYNTILYSLSIYINGSSKWAFSSNDGIGLWVSTNISKDTNKHTYKIGYPNGGYLYIDSTQSSKIGGTQNNTANQSLVVFADKKETGDISGFAKIKEWYFIIYQYSFIKQYLVPVPKGMLIGDKIAPSNCMFDMVTQTFFENQGTGDFIIGGLSGDYINVGDNIVWVDENVYLKSTRTQYIDTNYKPNSSTNLETYIKFSGTAEGVSTQYPHCNIFFGSCDYLSDPSQSYNVNFGSTASEKNIFIWVRPYVQGGTTWPLSNNSGYLSKCFFKIDGTTVIWGDVSRSLPEERQCDVNNNMFIFGGNYNGDICEFRKFDMQVYNYFKITEDNKIMRYFLPVNTGTVIGSFTVPAPGMWDAVTKKFYPNKGTGSFTYGKDE